MNITIMFCDKEYFVRGLYFGTYISLVMSFINIYVNNKPLIKATVTPSERHFLPTNVLLSTKKGVSGHRFGR